MATEGRIHAVVDRHVVVKIAAIVDVAESLDRELLFRKRDEKRERKDAVRIELDTLWSDRRREIHPSVGLEHSHEIVPTQTPAIDVDTISIAAEPKVLQRVKAGKRIAALVPTWIGFHDVALSEYDSIDRAGIRANVEDLD